MRVSIAQVQRPANPLKVYLVFIIRVTYLIQCFMYLTHYLIKRNSLREFGLPDIIVLTCLFCYDFLFGVFVEVVANTQHYYKIDIFTKLSGRAHQGSTSTNKFRGWWSESDGSG